MKAGPGTYVIVLATPEATRLTIGRRSFDLLPGYHCYVGSAFGPGGVRTRVSRHLGTPRRLHWHVDHLHGVSEPLEAWTCHVPRKLEHRWAELLGGPMGLTPVTGFGATDCRCPSHLFHGTAAPQAADFSHHARVPVARWPVPAVQ